MRAVVVIEDVSEREVVSRALQRAGFGVGSGADVAAGVAAIAREPPDVVVFAWTSGQESLRVVRADASGKAHVVALVDPQVGSRVATAAGAHDVLVRPFTEVDLVARVQSAARQGRRVSSHQSPTSELRAVDSRAQVDIQRLSVWKNLGTLVAADLSEMVGQPVKSTPGFPAGLGLPLRCATIPMTLAREGIELAVSVAADPATQAWLAGALLGDASAGESALNDVLRELASTAGGAFKRAALPDNVTLTTGLPINVPAVRGYGEGTAGFGLLLERGKSTLALVAELRRRENRQVRASELVEGMVVVNDVRAKSGALLVTAGSRLTRTTAERLGSLLGPKFLVEVAFAA
jgi:CheY-like chemotaxis protein